MAHLVIHAFSVGEGILAITSLPGRNGDYVGDIAHIREWKPGLVLSMTTDAEMEVAGAQTLGGDVQTAGSSWAHLQIQNYGAPPNDVLALWPDASAAAVATLKGGGRVLLHCRGGCGRSGMIALRLMIEVGEAPLDAFARLRAVRNCAVETEAQMTRETRMD
jgi:protein-tyrosine phosphatase